MIGQTLGHFRITARLGSGGMGVVYRAFDETLQRTVAIKIVGRETGTPELDRHRIVEEARAASGLNHPHICTVYETGEIEGQAYIAMEYVEGKPLSELIPIGGLPVEALLRYGVQIADALAHAHGRSVIHRDLKTPNVVVNADGRAKVLDFGLARRIPADIATTVTRSSDAVAPGGGVQGTLSYIAPEVLLGDTADERSDIWALGVLLYEMATGDLPFKGRNDFDLTAAILRAPPQPLPTSIPPIVRAVIQRCLAKEPAQRYQFAGETRAALEAIQSDVSATLPASLVSPRTSPDTRRWVIAAAIVAVVLAAAIWYGRGRGAPPGAAAGGGRLTLALASEQPVFDAAISADGKMLAYGLEEANGASDLFVRRVAGGGLVRLTNDKARETAPRFSPDGDSIAFTRRESPDGTPEVRVIPALGGDPMAIIPRASGAVWSPDGAKLAFLKWTTGGPSELVIAARDGSNPQVLLSGDSALPFLRHPAWSSDGSELAIVRGTGGIAGEIWRVPVGGGTPRRLMTDPPEVFSESPVYTHDGLGPIHVSNRGGATNIWLYPLRGGTPVRLTAGPGPDTGPTVAADGTISFINSRWRNTLEVYALTGAQPRTLVSHSPYIWGPAFSPDGKEIAFSRGEVDGSWHVWTVPADGGTAKRITSSSNGEIYPRYSPDGSSILFQTWGLPRRIATVSRDGGMPQMLAFGQGNVGYPDVSPDGKWITLTRTDADAERIYIAPAAGGEPRLLTKTVGAVAKWSPDGRSLVFAGNRGFGGGIFVINADGTNERRLSPLGGWPVWFPEGKQVGFLSTGRTGDQEIQVVPISGGPSRVLANIRFGGSNHPFDISRDGASLVTSNTIHLSDEIWLMETGR